MNGANLKNIADESELVKRGSVRARIGEPHACASWFSQHPKWETHAQREDDVVDVSEGLKIVIWDKAESDTIVLMSGDVAILPHNIWRSPVRNDEVSMQNMGDYTGTVVSDNDDPRP